MYLLNWASLVAPVVKNLPAMQETWVWSLGQEDPWRREWQPTPVFLPGEFHGWRSLAGYSPWGSQSVIYSLVTNTFSVYVFIWLHQVWVVAWGIFVESFRISCCDTQILYLWPVGSVVACGISCSVAWSILFPWPGMEPTHPLPALQGRFLTTGLPGKSMGRKFWVCWLLPLWFWDWQIPCLTSLIQTFVMC